MLLRYRGLYVLHVYSGSPFYRERIGGCDVTVAVTPNGYADAVTDGKFVMPEERRMTMADFLDILDHPARQSGIFYIQKQNSNFTDEFEEIVDDVESDIQWGTEAFGMVIFTCIIPTNCTNSSVLSCTISTHMYYCPGIWEGTDTGPLRVK